MPREDRAQRRRRSAAVLLITLTLGLPGCGGGGGGGGTTPTTPQPVRRLIAQGNFTLQGLPRALAVGIPFDAARSEFTTSATGTLESQCDWTFPSNDVDIAIYRGSCTFSQFYANQCNLLVESTSTTAKPERVTATNAPAGLYTWIVANFGLTNESGNCQIYLTS